MTTFRVTQCHRSDLPACGSSAPIAAEYGRVSNQRPVDRPDARLLCGVQPAKDKRRQRTATPHTVNRYKYPNTRQPPAPHHREHHRAAVEPQPAATGSLATFHAITASPLPQTTVMDE